jgi:hypothetical protein
MKTIVLLHHHQTVPVTLQRVHQVDLNLAVMILPAIHRLNLTAILNPVHLVVAPHLRAAHLHPVPHPALIAAVLHRVPAVVAALTATRILKAILILHPAQALVVVIKI